VAASPEVESIKVDSPSFITFSRDIFSSGTVSPNTPLVAFLTMAAADTGAVSASFVCTPSLREREWNDEDPTSFKSFSRDPPGDTSSSKPLCDASSFKTLLDIGETPLDASSSTTLPDIGKTLLEGSSSKTLLETLQCVLDIGAPNTGTAPARFASTS